MTQEFSVLELDGPNARPAVVLNVNDNEAARYMTSLILKRAGYEVLEASDGTRALELVRMQPDVVVLDVRLPDIDGIEVCRRIKSDPALSWIKVLHTSATFVTAEKKVRGLDVGADGYLTQPFEPEELAATVRALVRLRRAEQQLRDRASQLAEADRRKDEFLAMLAHELRNPLSAISAALPLMQQRPPSTDAENRARSVAQRQVVHLSRLVDDLLDVARVTRGRIELKREQVNLSELLRRVVNFTRDAKALQEEQTVELTLPKEPLLVDGDPLRLEQIFTNLLDNACKYTPRGGRLTVEAAVESLDPPSLRIAVTDTGVGMDADALASIFGLFSQAQVSLDRSRGGLGIGLTLVKALVEQHGGSVTAESTGLGHGSRFVVRLPLIARLADAAVEPLPEAGEASQTPRRIVIVEDNADVRETLVDLCMLWNHEVTACADGVEAVETLLSSRPDVALIDIGLPGIDGYEVVRRVRADPRGADLKLVALTGYGAAEQRERAREAGFNRHLVKPIDINTLEKLLEDLDQREAGFSAA